MTLAQCAAVFIYAIALIVADVRGVSDASLESESSATGFVGAGTAAFLIIVFGFIAFVSARTAAGRPTGRGAVVLIEAILLGVAFYMFSGGAIALGVVTLISAAAVLFTIFHPASVRYAAATYGRRGE